MIRIDFQDRKQNWKVSWNTSWVKLWRQRQAFCPLRGANSLGSIVHNAAGRCLHTGENENWLAGRLSRENFRRCYKHASASEWKPASAPPGCFLRPRPQSWLTPISLSEGVARVSSLLRSNCRCSWSTLMSEGYCFHGFSVDGPGRAYAFSGERPFLCKVSPWMSEHPCIWVLRHSKTY